MQLYFIMQENVLFSIKTLYYKRINVYWDQSDVGQEAIKRFYRSLNVLCTVYGKSFVLCVSVCVGVVWCSGYEQ